MAWDIGMVWIYCEFIVCWFLRVPSLYCICVCFKLYTMSNLDNGPTSHTCAQVVCWIWLTYLYSPLFFRLLSGCWHFWLFKEVLQVNVQCNWVTGHFSLLIINNTPKIPQNISSSKNNYRVCCYEPETYIESNLVLCATNGCQCLVWSYLIHVLKQVKALNTSQWNNLR